MSKVELHQSDFSDQLITNEQDRAMMVVRHEDFSEPKQLDALREEVVDQLKKLSLQSVVRVDLYLADEEEPQSFVLDAKSFAKLSPERPMKEIMEAAPAVKRLGRGVASAAGVEPKRDYTSIEWAGAPHKGKTTEQEKELVRDNFDEINARLVEQGLRPIDLTNKEHVERYGLQALANERGVE